MFCRPIKEMTDLWRGRTKLQLFLGLAKLKTPVVVSVSSHPGLNVFCSLWKGLRCPFPAPTPPTPHVHTIGQSCAPFDGDMPPHYVWKLHLWHRWMNLPTCFARRGAVLREDVRGRRQSPVAGSQPVQTTGRQRRTRAGNKRFSHS